MDCELYEWTVIGTTSARSRLIDNDARDVYGVMFIGYNADAMMARQCNGGWVERVDRPVWSPNRRGGVELPDKGYGALEKYSTSGRCTPAD